MHGQSKKQEKQCTATSFRWRHKSRQKEGGLVSRLRQDALAGQCLNAFIHLLPISILPNRSVLAEMIAEMIIRCFLATVHLQCLHQNSILQHPAMSL